ncbi:MAG: antitoxin Xre/MbcA/ParS toxin-binding domain-containing protein [Desulfovermiculus sp.]|nr:antitoxin Xre/MbcA/ParS toxin-binding domain-containing protein [Desulfovermiculus sp.]
MHQTEEELRNKAELDEKAQVQAIHFAWSREGHTLSKGLDNTTLGHIWIEGNRMNVEVNSEAREDRIREEIDNRLGDKATYKGTDIRSLESLMAEGSSGIPSWKQDETEQKALNNSPEVQEAIRKVLIKHWEGWIDSELPALSGKTPRQAVQTEDGREAVQALLRDIESTDKRSNIPVSQQPFVDWARNELGLPDT